MYSDQQMDSYTKHSGSPRGYRRKSKSSGSSRPQKLNRIFTVVSAVLGGILLLVVAFVAGRNSAGSALQAPVDGSPSASAQPLPAQAAATESTREAIELALRHYKQGSIPEAIEVLTLHTAQGHPSVQMLLARIEGDRGNAVEATNWISPDLTRGSRQYDMLLLKAELLAASGGHQAAFVEYEQAAQLAPLEARVFLSWGQALRDYGRTREAMQRLEQASLRTRNASEDIVVQSRILLARTELENADSLKTEAAPLLAAQPADPLWQLAMASVALRENDTETAADLLRGAKTRLPAALYSELVTDPAFAPHLHDPAMRGLLQ